MAMWRENREEKYEYQPGILFPIERYGDLKIIRNVLFHCQDYIDVFLQHKHTQNEELIGKDYFKIWCISI